MCFTLALMIFERCHQKSCLWGSPPPPPSCGDVQSQSISLLSRPGQNIIYQDFSSICKRIVYSKSKKLEMLDLLKKGNCTIFAAKIKAWNSWVETAQPICAFVFFFFLFFFVCVFLFFFVAKTFFLLMLLIINFISDVRCALHV